MPELSVLLDGDDAERPDTRSIEREWGISFGFPLFGPLIRILFVIDGQRITTGHGSEEFGLGYVLDTLRSKWFAWWVRFEVTVVNRNAPENFRFTDSGFDVDQFDQIWFFGDNPGEVTNKPWVGDDIIENQEYAPLDDAELLIVARWMDAGGGVFATGDHAMLGASMCHKIPRVRSMRKWTRAQGVPPFSEPGRHETYRRTLDGNVSVWEGDASPQRISPVPMWPGVPTYSPLQQAVHPLLCGRAGVIDQFPDHMHEGSVVEDDDVDLDNPLNILGFDGAEFPVAELVVAAAVIEGTDVALGNRPLPQVIAHGWTTNPDNVPRRFPLISVYDGEPAKVGRVVVDSTWHHWFSMNLVGLRENNPEVYRAMQDYYRNVAIWLATRQQRASMLIWATWGVVVGKHPGAMDPVMGVWELGGRVVDVLGRTAPQCLMSEFVDVFVPVVSPPAPPAAQEAAVGESAQEKPVVVPTRALVNQAVVGGVALKLLDYAHAIVYRANRGEMPEVDTERIGAMANAGARVGLTALKRELLTGADQLAKFAEQLVDEPEPPEPAYASD